MAIAAGVPTPAVYVVPDADPECVRDRAAIRRTRRSPSPRACSKTLNREELQGVVAHEMAHIRNLDIRLMTVVAALVGAVALLADWSGRAMRFGGGAARSRATAAKRRRPALLVSLVVWIVAIILAPIIGAAAGAGGVARREYLADATGAELTRNPLGARRARSRRSKTPSRRRRRSSAAPRTCASPIRSARSIDDGEGAGRTCGRRIRRWPAHRGAQGDGVRRPAPRQDSGASALLAPCSTPDPREHPDVDARESTDASMPVQCASDGQQSDSRRIQ